MNQKSIQELLEHRVITRENAEAISAYFKDKEGSRSNHLIIAFAILGALLVGLGIILILAHNWDQFNRLTKVVLVFIPLLMGQGLCAYVLRSRPENVAWKEGVSTFLFFAVAAVIALIGQIYNLPGSAKSFTLTWMLLIAPLMYITDSKVITTFFLIGITHYARLSFFSDLRAEEFTLNWYWLLLLIPIPFYWNLIRDESESFTTSVLHWLFPLSICVGLGSFFDKNPVFMLVTYMSLMAIFYLISKMDRLDRLPLMRNGYRVISTIGSIGILLPLTFAQTWEGIMEETISWGNAIHTPELIVAILVSVMASALLIWTLKSSKEFHPLNYLFLLFAILFIMGCSGISPRILINILVLLMGVFYVRLGSEREHFGILNFGLIVITVLIACRFFDFEISYILRGLLFVAAGIGFFVTNFWMYKRRQI